MWSLFSTSPEQSGFRLQYMEIYNWGTFDGKVFRISPQSNNSLLTGANGSGKTTFVDALLTLLVPLKKDRFYNQSSGVEKKGDRTEESYVYGYYGDIQKEGSTGTVAQKLRGDNALSVVLACFENEEGACVTLFQCRWFSNKNLKRLFGIAHKPLEIERDIHPFDPQGNWKKRLEFEYNTPTKRNIEYFNDSPSKYAERMIQLFGMRSSKALSLFNQTVGIKVLGNLDEFIRTNMLEPQDTEREWLLLKESFNTLLSTKVNIEKSKEQIAYLKPIKEEGSAYKEMAVKVDELREDLQLADTFFILNGIKVFAEATAEAKRNNQLLVDKVLSISREIDEAKNNQTDLTVQIKNDDVGRQLKDLERKFQTLQMDRDARQAAADRYLAHCRELSYSESIVEKDFQKNILSAGEDKGSFEAKIEDYERRVFELEQEQSQYNRERNAALKELDFLKKNKSNIPPRVSAIRDSIASKIGCKASELPFVGETIQLKDTEGHWELAVEKVLHSFALSMIVPEKLYTKVNKYINNTDLKGRLVYFKHEKTENLSSLHSTSDDHLISKLDFNAKSPYKDWVSQKLIEQYDFICVEDSKNLGKHRKAVTANGLVKFGNNRHEKDDRAGSKNKRNYVLGWNNEDKVDQVKQTLKELDKSLERLSTAIIQKRSEKATLNGRLNALYELTSGFKAFSDIDVSALEKETNEVQDQISQLQSTDNRVRILQAQLNKTELQLRALEDKKAEVLKEQWSNDSRINAFEAQWRQLVDEKQKLTDEVDPADLDMESFEKRNPGLKLLGVKDFSDKRQKYSNTVIEELADMERKGAKLRESLQKKMLQFKNPPERLVLKYRDWRSEVIHLPEDVDYVEAYFVLLDQLEQDNLPQYEHKFENYLTDTLLGRVGEFKHFFDNWKSKIEENIQALNVALSNIDYKDIPKTYIQLVAQRSNYAHQRTFRTFLEKAMPNAVDFESDLEEKKKHFDNNIRPLIDKLESDERWRKEVMDVRTWFKFFAEEYYKESGEKMKSYENMGKLSGGEKAQLTYTILGSAISYQFGMTTDGMQTKSFRFIAIDESFSNQDDEKARYLMNLCKQLKLQLLVVTPSDKINVVQDYISYVHLVERRNNKNSWLYDMPIMKFLEKQEQY